MRNWYKSSTSRVALAAGLALVALATSGGALAGPTGGQVAAGQATISGQGTSAVVVTQTTDRSIITWQTFNTTSGQSIQFVQPNSSSIALNRVVGGGPSSLNGSLTANGRVFIINPNGVLFGKSSQVNVAGLLVSSADVNSASFMSGASKLSFDTAGSPSAVIENDGNITIADSGLAAFVAPQVINSGIITARYGQIAIGAAETFTLDLNGDGLISFAPGDGATTSSQSGAAIQAGGQILASSGTVTLTAATARQVVNQSIEVTGLVSAASTSVTANGKVHLGGGAVTLAAAGDVKLDQSASLSAASAQGQGGQITVTGANIEVAGAKLTASGATGGGQVLIGGGAQGQGPLAHAKTTVLDPGTQITADATVKGNGGHVVLWSDQATSFAGLISARGGPMGGNGGLVETSSANNLQILGLVSADAQSSDGSDGTWLLDPADITIVATGANAGVTQTGATWAASGATGTLAATTINAALQAGTNVIVDSNSGGGKAGTNGNITFNSTAAAPITISSGTKSATLTLNAALGIDFGTNTTFTATTGTISVNATASAGVIKGVGTVFNTNGGSVNLSAINPPAPGTTWQVNNGTTYAQNAASLYLSSYVGTISGGQSYATNAPMNWSGAIYFNGLILNVGSGTAILTGAAGTNEPKTNGLDFNYDSGVLLGGIVQLTTASASSGAITINGTGRIGVMLGAPSINMVTNGNVTINGTASGLTPLGAGIGLGYDYVVPVGQTGAGTKLNAVLDQSGNLTLNGAYSGTAVSGTSSFTYTANGTTYTMGSTAQAGVASILTTGATIQNAGTGTVSITSKPSVAKDDSNDPQYGVFFTNVTMLNATSGTFSINANGGYGDYLNYSNSVSISNSAAGTFQLVGQTVFNSTQKAGVNLWLTSLTNGTAGASNTGSMTISGTASGTSTSGSGVFLNVASTSPPINNYDSLQITGASQFSIGLQAFAPGEIANYGSQLTLQGTSTNSWGVTVQNLTLDQYGPASSVVSLIGSGAVGLIFSDTNGFTNVFNRNGNGGAFVVQGTQNSAGYLTQGAIQFQLASSVTSLTTNDLYSQANPSAAGIKLIGIAANGYGVNFGTQTSITTKSGSLEIDGNVPTPGLPTPGNGAGIYFNAGTNGLSLANNGTTLTLYGMSTGAPGLLSATTSLGPLILSGSSSGAISLVGYSSNPVTNALPAVSLNFTTLTDTATSPLLITGVNTGSGGGLALTLSGAAGNAAPFAVTGPGSVALSGTTNTSASAAGSSSGLSLNVSGGGLVYDSSLTLYGYAAGSGAGVNLTATGGINPQTTLPSGATVSYSVPLTVIGASGFGVGVSLNAASLYASDLYLIGNPTTGNNGGLSLPSIIPSVATPGSGTGLSLTAPILNASSATLIGNSTAGTGVTMSDTGSITITNALTIIGDPTAGSGIGVALSTGALNAGTITITGYSTAAAGVTITDGGAFTAGTSTTPANITLTGGSTGTTSNAAGISLSTSTLTAGTLSITGTATAGAGVSLIANSLTASPTKVSQALIKGTSTSGTGLALALNALSAPKGIGLSGTSTSGTGLSFLGGTTSAAFSLTGLYATSLTGQTATNCTLVCFSGSSTRGTGLSATLYGLSDTASLLFFGNSTSSTGLSFTGGGSSTAFATSGISYVIGNLQLVGASTSGTGLALQTYGAWTNGLGLTGTGTSASGTGLNFAMTSVGTPAPSVNNGSSSPAQSPAGLNLTGISTTGTGLNFASSAYGLLNGTFSFTGQSNGTASTPSGSGITFASASPLLTLTQANLTLTGTRTAPGAGTSDLVLSGLTATGDANSTITLNGNYISFTNLTFNGFTAITLDPTDLTSGFSLLGQTQGANIFVNAASSANAATLTLGSNSETGPTTLASVTDNETGAVSIFGGSGALSLGGLTANSTTNVYVLDAIGTVASAGLTITGPLSATKAAVVLGSNGGIRDTATVKAASLAVQAGGAVTLNNTSNAFPLLAVSTSSGNIDIFDSSSVTLTSLSGATRSIKGLVDNSSLASDTVRLISAGAINISQPVSVASSGSSATPALILAAGYGQNVATQSTNGIVASGADVALTGDMLFAPANAINIGGQGTAIIYTGTLAGSAGLTDASDGGVGTLGGYRYNSSLTAKNYSLELGAGIDVVYREQPQLTSTWSVPGAVFANSGTGATATLTYNGKPVAPGLAIASQLFNGDTITLSGTLSASLSVAATGTNPLNNGAAQDVGTYSFGATSISNGLGYAVIAPGPLSLTINPYILNVTYGSGLSVQSKTYDGTTTANLTVTGAPTAALLGNDAQSVAVSYANGTGPTGVYAQADVGNNIAVSLNNLALVSLSKTNANANIISDYTVVGPANLTGTITPASLTISGISALSRAYNGGYGAQLQVSNNATINGWVSTADSSSVGVNLAALSGSFNTNQVGNNLSVNISAPTQGSGPTVFTGSSSAIAHILQDYTLVLPNVTANITPVTLTYNANSLLVPTLTYNGSTNATINVANPANPNLFSGYVGSDTSATTPAVTTKMAGTYDAPDAGNRTVTITPGSITLKGANANDYLVPTISLAALIKPATLVVSGLTAANKQYDGTSLILIDTSGLNLNIPVAADVGKLSLTGTPTGLAAQKDVGGNIAVRVQNLALAQVGPWQNYTLVIPQLTTAITPAPLTIGGLSVQTRDYDGTTVANLQGAAQLVGLLGGDQVQLSSAGVTANYATSSVGVNKPVSLTSTSYGLTGAQAFDYTLTLPSLSGTITPKTLTVSGLSATNRTYDGSTIDAVTGVPTLNGVVKGDSLAINTVGLSGTLSDPNVGLQNVTVQGLTLSGASALNYTLQVDVLSAAITPAPLTVSGLTAQSKTYDGTTLATLTGTAQVSGIITGDQGALQVLGTPSGAFASANVGVNLAVTLKGVTLGGAKAYDYQLLPTTLSASISPATLTYLASPSTRLLGTPNPPLTGTVTGLVAGQTLASATTGTLNFTSPAGTYASYGSYPIEGSGLSAVNDNYVFVQDPRNVAALTVVAPFNNSNIGATASLDTGLSNSVPLDKGRKAVASATALKNASSEANKPLLCSLIAESSVGCGESSGSLGSVSGRTSAPTGGR